MLNKVVLMGRFTKDPELRYTANQTQVCSFTIACDRDFGGKDGDKQTDFIDCVAWRSTAEYVNKYFGKGMMAVVSGRLQIRTWEDNNGTRRRNAEIIVDNVYFGDSKRKDEYADEPITYTDEDVTKPLNAGEYDMLGEDDELPF